MVVPPMLLMEVTLNRTMMELKYISGGGVITNGVALNRTMMELKCVSAKKISRFSLTLNRTMMELKFTLMMYRMLSSFPLIVP